jgi:hypothetical protein
LDGSKTNLEDQPANFQISISGCSILNLYRQINPVSKIKVNTTARNYNKVRPSLHFRRRDTEREQKDSPRWIQLDRNFFKKKSRKRTCLREETTTEAPSWPKRSAMAKPMPCVDAVTMATLPSNRPFLASISLLLFAGKLVRSAAVARDFCFFCLLS